MRGYLSSIDNLEQYAQVVRDHWRIENQQHWVLDVQFSEDANRTRKNHSATNLALVRRTALNLLRHADDSKRSLRRRKMRAALNDDIESKCYVEAWQHSAIALCPASSGC